MIIPQQYPVCQPVYGMVDKPPSRSNSVQPQPSVLTNVYGNSAANANALAECASENLDVRAPSVQSVDNSVTSRNSSDVAFKIQQIKDQMAQLTTAPAREHRPYRQENWRRRNPGNGILGSYPVGFAHRMTPRPPVHDETPLASAAKVIVNSIRTLQVKGNYQDSRREYAQHQRPDRPERRRPERDGDRHDRERERDRDRALRAGQAAARALPRRRTVQTSVPLPP
ncbi:hypothetical protein ACJJTC_016245, partial [Scirpophaga incertulas]